MDKNIKLGDIVGIYDDINEDIEYGTVKHIEDEGGDDKWIYVLYNDFEDKPIHQDPFIGIYSEIININEDRIVGVYPAC